MNAFIKKLLMFLGPIIIFLVIPISILFFSKENFFSIVNVVKLDQKYLIGYVYNENNYHYLKWEYLNTQPVKNVWALGSSRVLSFREEMFDTSFYNAGYTILNINDFVPFLKSIPKNKYPKYLIIGLDQWMFNEHHDNLNTMPDLDSWKNSFQFYPEQYAYLGVYKDLFAGKYNFWTFMKGYYGNKIGLNAVVDNKGFENDGSMYYGDQIAKLIDNDPTANDYKYTDTFKRINTGINLFEYADVVNDKAISELDNLLKFCTENDIQVIAFLPPFADKVYEEMAVSDHYGYLNKIYPRIKPVFDKYGYEIYDFSTVSSVGSSDSETLDGFHGSDVTYQRLLIKMLDSGSVLNRVADAYKLEQDLSNKINNYSVYAN